MALLLNPDLHLQVEVELYNNALYVEELDELQAERQELDYRDQELKEQSEGEF